MILWPHAEQVWPLSESNVAYMCKNSDAFLWISFKYFVC